MYKLVIILWFSLKISVLCQFVPNIEIQKCFGDVECPQGTYYVPKSIMKGLCGDCVSKTRLAGYGDPCSSKACAPGLKCDGTNICDFDKNSCLYSKFVPNIPDLKWQPPKCLPDGTYAPVQCKGELMSGRCFCTDAIGNRIFGSEWWRNKGDMSCACSRKRWEMENDPTNPRNDVTLHCNSAGGFEELQCDAGMCWCTEEHTGSPKIGIPVVPETLVQILPCYNVLKLGDRYLRQCESAKHARANIVNKLKEHGTTAAMTSLFCDYDGSYGLIEFEKAAAYCIWKDKKRLSPFQAEAQGGGLLQINCNCARDTVIYEEEEIEFEKMCAQNGNYKDQQHKNGEMYCVDSDGFAVTDTFPVGIDINCEVFLKYTRRPDPKI